MQSLKHRLSLIEQAQPRPVVRAYLIAAESEFQARKRLGLSEHQDAFFIQLVPLKGRA
ncbi:hypothetical protein VARIO8X_90058 [Burkholderiales bacterium 8X]|nr:hypothetical protein VARIO8X_90058 [Burkholderiales bacterium 8X]